EGAERYRRGIACSSVAHILELCIELRFRRHLLEQSSSLASCCSAPRRPRTLGESTSIVLALLSAVPNPLDERDSLCFDTGGAIRLRFADGGTRVLRTCTNLGQRTRQLGTCTSPRPGLQGDRVNGHLR